MKLSKSTLGKLNKQAVETDATQKIQNDYENLDQLHEEVQTAAEEPPLKTGAEQGRTTPEGRGNGGSIPPVEHRFQPGQSGNPGGRPAGVSRLVRQLLSHNEAELARQVAKAWIEQACKGRQTALSELLKRADGIPPNRAEREDIFHNLPPGATARANKRCNAAIKESKRQTTPWSNAE